MGKSFWIAIVFLSALFSCRAQSAFGAASARKLMAVRIGTVSRSTLDMPFLVARDRGLFREEGCAGDRVDALGPNHASAAGGRVDFGTATGTAVSAAVNGIDIRVIMAMSDKPSFDLFSQPSITSIQQLRGKKIGVGGLGALTDNMLRQILAASQIPVNQVIASVGASSITFASLKSGIIDATMLQIPQNFLAQDEGFRSHQHGLLPYRAGRPDDDQSDYYFRETGPGHQSGAGNAARHAVDQERQEICAWFHEDLQSRLGRGTRPVHRARLRGCRERLSIRRRGGRETPTRDDRGRRTAHQADAAGGPPSACSTSRSRAR